LNNHCRNNVAATNNGKVLRGIRESQSLDKSDKSFDKSLDNSDRSTKKLNKSSEKSFDRSELTEKSIERLELSERSIMTDFEPSITISVMPIEADEVSFAFSIDDEIPFIDEDSLTSLSKSLIRVDKTAIPLSSFFKEKV
jgi:hypothetical protein